MADDDGPAKPAAPAPSIEAPMLFMKGGTTTGAHDRLMAQQRADTDQRRAIQDRQFAVSQQDPLGARMRSMKLGGADSPKIVVALKHPKDNLYLDWIVCDLIDQGDELILNMACPHCRVKNPGHEPDFMIRQSNRKWHLDRSRAPKWMREVGVDRLWINPVDGSTVVVAGTVTTEEWIRCPGLGCTWRFTIDDSVAYSQ
jgi:hypothetical protein